MLDFAAIHTLLNGGTVYAVEPEQVPDGALAAAIFRFYYHLRLNNHKIFMFVNR